MKLSFLEHFEEKFLVSKCKKITIRRASDMKTKNSILILSLVVMVIISCGGGIKDKDGNVYKSVQIGNQVWLAENLNTSYYRNGDKIPEAKTEREWEAYGNEGIGAWCYYENDAANGKKYGKLYNWYAVKDPRGFAPKGWHVPSDAEWTTLMASLGGEDDAGAKMKSNSGWENDGNGTNESGFSALPGGFRSDGRGFVKIGSVAAFWSSSEKSRSYASGWALGYDSEVDPEDIDKYWGCSIRCIKD